MRIALFHNLPSGGAKRTLYEMVRRLANEHTIDVFTLSAADHDFADLRPYAHQHHIFPFRPGKLFSSPFGRLNQAVRWSDLQRLRRLTKRIAGAINQGGYDLLFAHPCQFEKCSSVVQFARLPTVYYCQEPLRQLYEEAPYRPYEGRESSRRRLLNRIDPLPKLYYSRLQQVDRENTRTADLVLVNSRFMEDGVSRIYGVPAQVSYHGVDVDWFRPLDLPRERFVLSVGSLTPMKGFDFLVQAVAAMPAAARPPLVIASNFQNPPERAYLEALAAKLEIDLQLVGNVTDERLVALYNQAALVAYAPVREPFGLVPLEAMACGTAVVAVREGGIPETVVDGQTGCLTERDPAAFARALQTLLAEPALAATYGQNGRALVNQAWTWDTAVAAIEQHLFRLVPFAKLDQSHTV